MKKRNLLKAGKRLLALIVVTMMIAGILPVVSFAAVPDDVVFWNFSDEEIVDLSPENGIITYGANSAVVCQSRGGESDVGGAVAPDDKYGTSIKFDITPTITDNGYMNIYYTTAKTTTQDNLVIGMSLYLDKDMDYSTHFRAQGTSKNWDVQRSIANLFSVAGSEITTAGIHLADVTQTGWYEFRVSLNYKKGCFIVTCIDAAGNVHQSAPVRVQGRVDGFNLGQLQNHKNSSAYSIYVDNVRIYKEANYSVPADITVDEDYNITVDFNAEVFADANAAISFTNLYTEETSGTYEYVKNDNGFITGIKITPDSASSNILSVSGLKTVYGSEISFTDYISADYIDYVTLVSDFDPAAKHFAGNVKTFSVDATDGEVTYYNNGKAVGYAQNGDKISVVLENGINIIEAKKGDASFRFSPVYADAWNLVKTTFKDDFNTGTHTASYVSILQPAYEQNIGGNETYSVYFPPTTNEAHKLVAASQLGNAGYYMTYSVDWYFKDTIVANQSLGTIKISNSGTAGWFDAFSVTPEGAIKTSYKNVAPAGTIVPNTWYTIRTDYDPINGLISLHINGELISQYVPHSSFTALDYVPIVPATDIYLDNLQIDAYESAAPSIELTSYIYGDVTPGETVKLSLNPKNIPNGAVYKAYVDGALVEGAVDTADGTVNFVADSGMNDVYAELYSADGTLLDATETVSIAAGVTETQIQYSYPTIGWCIDADFESATSATAPDSSFGVGGVTSDAKLGKVDDEHGQSWLLDSPGGELYVNTAPKTQPNSYTFVLDKKHTVIEFELNPQRFHSTSAIHVMSAKYNNDSWINPIRIQNDGTVEIVIYDGTTVKYYAMPEDMEIGEWMKFKFVYYYGTNIGDVYINDYPVVKAAPVLPSGRTLSFINYPKFSIDGCAFYVDNYKLYTITKSTNLIANIENDNGSVEVLLGKPDNISAETCIIAVKDSAGKLIGASVEEVAFVNGVYAVSSKDFGALNDGDTVSVYVWESLTSLKPLTQDE